MLLWFKNIEKSYNSVNLNNLKLLFTMITQDKIGFLEIVKTLNMIFLDKDFKKYAKRKLRTIKDIEIVDNWARLKTKSMCVR